MIELALAMPVVLALIGAIADGGWALHQAALATAAAEAAQRAAAIQDTGTGHCAGAPPASYGDLSKAAAAAAAPTLDPSGTSVAVRYLEPACTGRMRTLIVDVTYTLHALTPWFAGLLNGRQLTAEAGSAVEEVPPSWWGSAAQVQLNQAQIASQLATINSQQSQLAADQSSINSQQSQIASLMSAYQAEVSLASSLSQAAAYYYAQWQRLVTQVTSDGTHEQ